MAEIGADPVLNTPRAAAAALDRDLPKVLQGRTLEEAGWERSDRLTIFVPFVGAGPDKTEDLYVVRLHFGYYPGWPPSTLFVNAETSKYEYPADVCWLPRIEGTNEISVHANYGKIGQLVCASVTLEFWKIKHNVKPEHVWKADTHNFAATLHAIEFGLRPAYYRGPQMER